jgi:uncharacterized OB-fold protein
MGLIDTYATRLKPELPYMTTAEDRLFKRLEKDGQITVFRLQNCESCGKLIPKPKRFCSKNCYNGEEQEDGG